MTLDFARPIFASAGALFSVAESGVGNELRATKSSSESESINPAKVELMYFGLDMKKLNGGFHRRVNRVSLGKNRSPVEIRNRRQP